MGTECPQSDFYFWSFGPKGGTPAGPIKVTTHTKSIKWAGTLVCLVNQLLLSKNDLVCILGDDKFFICRDGQHGDMGVI
jgi:hypothetical protein